MDPITIAQTEQERARNACPDCGHYPLKVYTRERASTAAERASGEPKIVTVRVVMCPTCSLSVESIV
jgi:DNA-directed RNA polymerase subunit RPC12/RpoP